MLTIQGSSFRKNFVEFLRAFLSKSRKDCQSIEETQLGRVLDAALLQSKEFESQQEDADAEMMGFHEDGDEVVELSG